MPLLALANTRGTLFESHLLKPFRFSPLGRAVTQSLAIVAVNHSLRAPLALGVLWQTALGHYCSWVTGLATAETA